MVRNGRIELPPDAWEAPVLPIPQGAKQHTT